MRSHLIGLFFILIFQPVFSQESRDQQAIQQLCGCFQVDFRYAETFAADTAYKFHPRYHTWAIELAYPEEVGPKKMVIQHLLLIDDTTIIKHWREDWTYEQAERWVFDGNAVWRHASVPADSVRGQWMQTVWEVDDAPRYQGSAQWVTVGGKYVWQNTTDAPLPRREYTKRNDYNIMERTNRIYATDTGWVHEQDNRKLIRSAGSPDRELAQEKGYNVYKRVGQERCAAAVAFWQQHRVFWKTVRAAWEAEFSGADRKTARLSSNADGQFLFDAFDDLESRRGAGVSIQEVRTLLAKYIKKS
jgi:hypothetical protein